MSELYWWYKSNNCNCRIQENNGKMIYLFIYSLFLLNKINQQNEKSGN